MTDLVSRLLEAITAKEEKAKAAKALHVSLNLARRNGKATLYAFLNDNDPSSVLRRCAADRRVLERHSPTLDHLGRPSCSFCSDAGHMEWPCEDFEDLADRYGLSDHQEGEE